MAHRMGGCSSLEEKKREYLILPIDIFNRCLLLSYAYFMEKKSRQGNVNLIFGVWLILLARQSALSPLATFGSPFVEEIIQEQGRESLFHVFAPREWKLKATIGQIEESEDDNVIFKFWLNFKQTDS